MGFQDPPVTGRACVRACARGLFSLSCIGEENGNPLQYCCLENSMDRGAWLILIKSHFTKEALLDPLGPGSSYRGSPLLLSLLLQVKVGTPGRQGGDLVSKVEGRQQAGPSVCCESSSSCSLASCALLKGGGWAGRIAPRMRWSDEGDLATRSNPPVSQSLSKPTLGSGHFLDAGDIKVNKPSSG